MQRIGCIRLTADEAAIYDSGDDIAGRALRADLQTRARDGLRRGAWQIEIVHPDGAVVWTFDRADYPNTLTEIYPRHRF